MAIAKKPNRNHNDITVPAREKAAEAFISAAGKPATSQNKKENKQPIMIRFDTEVLRQVDTAARRRGISRSAWIQFTVSRALDQGEG